ncbi:MAG: protein kinase [Gemmatimonadales bacterium]|nr:protein kinase [Gemmatimonadales bacterium]
MLRLETLGGLTLTDADGRHVASQRRRLALLALLAAGGGRGVPRDKVIACLWPESAAEGARHALEQLLYSVRRQLPGVLVPGSDPLRLNLKVVRTDLAELAERLAGGDLAGAVGVYRGPFLDGFFLSGAPEFEQWAERERARLAADHTRVLKTLADQAEASGQHTTEIDLRRQLAGTDPLGERAATDYVRALADSGDWAAAAHAARAFADRVRAELPGVAVSDLETLVDRLREDRRLEAREDSSEAGAPVRYVLERELGRGSVAVVYLARDRRYDRPVALKLLRPELATATDARRFRREIKILAHLYHPHILQLYDSGVLPPGSGAAGLYYVMPYVRGESLRQRLDREGTLTMEGAARIAADVAEALAYAHAQGVIHRDIRPENILLESGHALVADFGIAGVLETAGGERLSASGIALARPAYCSPEHARGGRELDGRSDLYSLGCVLYEMLGGEPPFSGANSTAVLARQVADAVPPLRTIRPDLSPGLERAVLRALAKQPEERYPTAGEFESALRHG